MAFGLQQRCRPAIVGEEGVKHHLMKEEFLTQRARHHTGDRT
jgi:hypothetical protein